MHRLLTYKKILLSALLASLFLLVPSAALAVDILNPVCKDPNNTAVTNSSVCQTNAALKDQNPLYGPQGILTTAVNILSIVVAVISVIIIIIAGIKFSLSQGENQKIIMARNQIIYALVGLVVAAVAQSLVLLVLNRI